MIVQNMKLLIIVSLVSLALMRPLNIPAMEMPEILIRECDMLLHWKKPASTSLTSYTIWAKTPTNRLHFHPFAENI